MAPSMKDTSGCQVKACDVVPSDCGGKASRVQDSSECQGTACDVDSAERGERVRSRTLASLNSVGIHRCSRSEVFLAVTQTLTERAAETATSKPTITPAITALIITSSLFTLITIAQVFGAQIARSQALLMDCISMGVDALTYMGNILVECRKRDGSPHNCSQLVVCAFSLSLLLFFTFDASRESLETAKVCWKDEVVSEGGDDVNGWIPLGFGAGGLIFDMVSLWAFHRSSRKEEKSVNMFTAFLHVAADFLRSGSTVIMSLLILVGKYDSTCLDAYTSLLIGASIICGGLVGIFNWLHLFYDHFCASRDTSVQES